MFPLNLTGKREGKIMATKKKEPNAFQCPHQRKLHQEVGRGGTLVVPFGGTLHTGLGNNSILLQYPTIYHNILQSKLCTLLTFLAWQQHIDPFVLIEVICTPLLEE